MIVRFASASAASDASTCVVHQSLFALRFAAASARSLACSCDWIISPSANVRTRTSSHQGAKTNALTRAETRSESCDSPASSTCPLVAAARSRAASRSAVIESSSARAVKYDQPSHAIDATPTTETPMRIGISRDDLPPTFCEAASGSELADAPFAATSVCDE